MRLNYSSILSVAALLGLAACSDETFTPDITTQHAVVITAVSEQLPPASRTCVDMSDTGNGYLGLLWNPGDSIGVFGNGTTRNALFRTTVTQNAAKADFAGEMTGGDKPYRAYYPYDRRNAGATVTDLVGTVAAEQPFDMTTGRLVCDYKYGAPVSEGSAEYSFRHLFSLLQIDIDASGTDLAGERLEYIELTVTGSDGSARAINGDFRFSAVDGSWRDVTGSTSTTRMPWTDRPVLGASQTYTGFITVIPDVEAGDEIAVTIVTEGHKATFKALSKITFAGGAAYNLPLTLGRFASDSQYGWTETARPALKSLRFTVAANQGKLLDNRTVWNDNDNPEFQTVTGYDATVTTDSVTLTIPCLYDFKLVPEFETSEGTAVKANGNAVVSGETEIDFTKPVIFTLEAAGESREYTVSVTNTGLPVVVINQSTSGDFSEVKTGGFLGIGGTVVNKFVDFMIRGKDAAWVNDDKMTVYNADGTVNMAEAACGVRLRGNTSKAYPKKPLAIKLDKKQAVLDMPSHKRWVLLANWLDHSMIRNTVASDVAHAIENAWRGSSIEPGIPWNTHGRNVELIIDGHHVGNYYLCEQIKIGKNRLNIQDAYEDVSDPTFATCGYLLELDNNFDETYRFITSKASVPFMFKDDIPDTGIFNSVKTKVQGIEDNLAAGNYEAAYEDLDIYSVIDQWIIWELTMNREFIEPRSVYYFMDGDGKLSAGPVWDFDRGTFQNTTNASSQGSDRVKPYNEWIYWLGSPKAGLSDPSENSSSIWYTYLFKDPNFCKAVQERWTVFYPYLQGVVNDIRRHGSEQALSWKYDSAMWPTDKDAIHKHKSGFKDWSGDENISSFDAVIENMVAVYNARLDGMNTLITSGKFTQ